VPGFPLTAGTQYPYGSLVSFRTEAILPPSAVYVGQDDTLILSVRNPSFATTVNVSVRFLTPQGELKPQLFTLKAASVGATPQLFTLTQSEGFIISASVSAPAASRGQVFVKLFLQRGLGSGDTTLGHVLVQDYVSVDDLGAYPQSILHSSIEGRGWAHTVVGTAPAAGANWVLTVPAGVRWRFISVNAQLVTSAVVANRNVRLFAIDNIGNIVVYVVPTITQAASLTIDWTWFDGAPDYNFSNIEQQMPIPRDLILGASWVVRSSVLAMQAADQWTAPFALVEEWVAQ
jgi:fumarate reductase subunit C